VFNQNNFGEPGGLCDKVFNMNKEIYVSKMMRSLPGCVYSRAKLQSNDCLKYIPAKASKMFLKTKIK
jgi:hypothetical protein